MTHTFTASESPKITLAPATLIEEILQNVSMIVSTAKTTVPLFRDFGLSATFLDRPTPAAEAVLIAEILDAVEMYEPRAEIISVSFSGDASAGKLVPRLEVGINAE
jgi:phage baseplate assembly protein W